jgi:heat shock protein HslJ
MAARESSGRPDARERYASDMARIRAPFAVAFFLFAAVALGGCAAASGDGIDPVGTWNESDEADAPSLTLANGGKLTGTDGCNQLSGSWRLEDDDLVYFDSVASTRMACPDVDVWLDKLSQASISGSTMTILSGDGAEIGQLERAD